MGGLPAFGGAGGDQGFERKTLMPFLPILCVRQNPVLLGSLCSEKGKQAHPMFSIGLILSQFPSGFLEPYANVRS